MKRKIGLFEARDLTTGGIYRNLFAMAVPTALGFLGQTIYDVVDMIWLGRISTKAVAGVTVFATIFWSVEALNEIIGISSVSLIGQSYGAKNTARTNRIIEQTLTFKSLVALIAMVILLLVLKPLLGFLTQDSTVLKDAMDYGYIRIFFLPIMFSSYTVNTALRCIGDAKSPMLIMLFAACLNIVLDPILIFDKIPGTSIPGLNLGVFGAALATVISTSIAVAIGFYLLYSGKRGVKISLKGLLKLDWSIDNKLITIGLPTGFELLSRNISWYIAMKIIASFGTVAVATIGIGTRFTGLLLMPILGLYVGSSSIIGQTLGANKIDRSKKTVKASAVLGMLIMGVGGIFALLFPDLIMRMFINEQPVIDLGRNMIRILGPGMVFLAAFYGFSSAFGGAGYMQPFISSTIISRWCFMIPLLILLIVLLKSPIEAIWIILILTDAVAAVVMMINYKRGKWEIKRV
ncbi:MAG TPA: MATE family efflux transporter [Thermotogota bacterium]|nr:MATE family efflux transporter [Thermotogota bacterium]